MTRTGHPFAGAVSRYGVTDPEALASTTHDFESRYLEGLLGRDRAVWRDRSPVHRLSGRTAPVLLLQGGRDPVVTADQASAFAAACRRHAVPHLLVEFPDEGHGFRTAAARTRALTVQETFLRQVLGLPGSPGPKRT